MTRAQAIEALKKAFRGHGVALRRLRASIPRLGPGKAYELFCLARFLDAWGGSEGFNYRLIGGSGIQFRLAGGPRNASYARIEVSGAGTPFGAIWTDLEFVALSAHSVPCPPARIAPSGQRHELDIVFVDSTLDSGYVCHENIIVGVECKARAFGSGLLKEVLGVRREMALLRPPIPTGFSHPNWGAVRAAPQSWLDVCCFSNTINRYRTPGPVFGIHFWHEKP